MVADAEALERQTSARPVLEEQAADFRGSFSGYERDRLFYNPSGGPRGFVQSAYVFGLDDDHDGRTAVPVDIDGDGDLDLALLTLRSLKLYENTAPRRRFARVRLEDSEGRAPALGAHVALTAGGITRRDFVRVTEGFRGQVPADLHFGLGRETTIEQLEVTWPGGTTQIWRGLPVDTLVTLREGTDEVIARELPTWPDATRPKMTGRPSPQVVAERLEGGSTPIGNGRPTVINFWAPWCAPCNVELPQLVTLAHRYDGQVDFAGLSVELSDLDSVRASIRQFAIPYPQFLADEQVMAQFFGDTDEAALPSTFVFDSEGQLRRLFRGAITESDLDGLLASFQDEGESAVKLRLLAETYFAAGDFEQAARYYRRLVERRPGRGDPIGMAWERQRAADRKRLAEALEALEIQRETP